MQICLDYRFSFYHTSSCRSSFQHIPTQLTFHCSHPPSVLTCAEKRCFCSASNILSNTHCPCTTVLDWGEKKKTNTTVKRQLRYFCIVSVRNFWQLNFIGHIYYIQIWKLSLSFPTNFQICDQSNKLPINVSFGVYHNAVYSAWFFLFPVIK